MHFLGLARKAVALLYCAGFINTTTSFIMSQEEQEQESRKRGSARQLTDRDDVDDIQETDSVCVSNSLITQH